MSRSATGAARATVAAVDGDRQWQFTPPHAAWVSEACNAAIDVVALGTNGNPVTGWLLRLPEQMGGGWVVQPPWSRSKPSFATTKQLRSNAVDLQKQAHGYSGASPGLLVAAARYTRARWWAEAYRVALSAERSRG